MADAYAMTLDIDWAPDWMIDVVADTLVEHAIRATWFATHRSPAVTRLEENPLFEIGIHPNFRPGSAHGSTEEEVLAHMMKLFPTATAMRTHSLVQSTPMLKLASEAGITTDVSLFVPGQPHLTPHALHFGPAKLMRIPFFWEDDLAFDDPNKTWDMGSLPGLKVYNFHPVHIVLNSANGTPYGELKENGGPEHWTRAAVAKMKNTEAGTETLFRSMIRTMGDSRTISGLAEEAAA